MYLDYYVFQFQDGSWRIAPMTHHQWNGRPDLPRHVLDGVYPSRPAAEAALRQAV
jgi:hypothetical protein